MGIMSRWNWGNMRRWRLPMALFVLVIISIFGVRHILEKRAQQRREVGYQYALRLYSEALKPGATRLDVEEYLHARNVPFRQMCCVDIKEFRKGVWDDLTKIGEEDVPWFCSQNNVYVAFQFSGNRHDEQTWHAEAGDTLKAVTIHHWLEGCL